MVHHLPLLVLHSALLQVPLGLGVSTVGSAEGSEADMALVISALRERYKVLTSRQDNS